MRATILTLCGLVMLVSTGSGAPADIPALDWTPRSDWVDVTALGAKADGQTDDTAAIQKALDGVANGATVYLPPGTYRITETLTLTGPLIGVLIVGHGRDTRLLWDGEQGGRLFMDDGVAYSRFVGIAFEGRGRASVGFFHHSDNRFETEVRHQHLAFRGFTDAGIRADREDKYALAETNFENCLFEDCGRGVAFISFNDYNYTFDGCEFRHCEIGIECAHGNFYVRNTHFRDSEVVDIRSGPEHASSVRRCTSVGSKAFIDHRQSVSPLTVQDCHVSGWTGRDGAITISGAPAMLFDCSFPDPPVAGAAVRIPRSGQRLIASCNRAEAPARVLPARHQAELYVVPPGERTGAITSAHQRFLQDNASVPTEVLDAREQFGAKGDGKADDTLAIQRAIDAARGHGAGALAYLPNGTYAISDTLRLTGSDYSFGGSGFMTRLKWIGPAGGTMVSVHDPQNLTLENLTIGHHDAGAFDNAVDVRQTHAGRPSTMTYDGVFAYGMYQRQPFRKGFLFTDLGADAVVLMRHVQGNMRFVDCARATILGNTTFEGSVIVEGKDPRRTGLLGFMTRLCTIVTHGLYLRDNQSIVMSDFYVEQADNGYVFEGSADLPPGRATIQGAKLHFTVGRDEAAKGTAMHIRNYGGQIFFGPDQFYVEPTSVSVVHEGSQALDLFLLGNCFYRTKLDFTGSKAAHIFLVGNEAVGVIEDDTVAPATYEPVDNTSAERLAQISRAMDDLRHLGEVDLSLNHAAGGTPEGNIQHAPSGTAHTE